jgi:predicted Zn-dependent peptidase
MYEDLPMRRVQEYYKTLLYGDTPLGWDIAGPKENIRNFKRRDFLRFLARAYTAENIVVGVAGNIDPKAVRQAVRAIFRKTRPGKKPRFKKASDRQSKPGIFIQKKPVDQTHLVLGVRAFDRFHPDRFVLSVIATILGGGMSSRLFIEVRERRGLAYQVRSDIDLCADAGTLETHAGVEHGNLAETIRVILSEYQKMKTELVSSEELAKAKENIKGHMALSLEGSDDVVEYLVGQETLEGRIVLPEEKMRAIDRVTAEDVLRVSQDLFQEKRLNLAVISPNAKRPALEKLLHL